METTYIFCSTEEELIKHLFFECVFTQLFWINVEYMIFKFTKLKICLVSVKYIFCYTKKKECGTKFGD